MLNHDPLITKKIYYIKSILKGFASDVKKTIEVNKYNQSIIRKFMIDNDCEYFDAVNKLKGKLKEHSADTTWCTYWHITALHIIYLKVKGVNKQHTKDDKSYENHVYFKITMEKLEKEFSLSQHAGKEGLYVNSNA